MSNQICSVILAAGKGTRMKSEHPKVATLLNGKPLIHYVLDNILASGIKKIYIIVGYKKEVVIDICKNYSNLEFIEQKEQLGTGHALLCSEPNPKDFNGNLLVACGDVPLITKKSFSSLIDYHNTNSNNATVLSCDFPDPKGYGRILRDSNNNITGIIEEKDSNEEQKLIKEINTGTYIFESPKVFQDLKSINTMNAQNEYYLPDLIKISISNHQKAGAFKLDNYLESTGVNSPEDLSRLENLIAEGKIGS